MIIGEGIFADLPFADAALDIGNGLFWEEQCPSAPAWQIAPLNSASWATTNKTTTAWSEVDKDIIGTIRCS